MYLYICPLSHVDEAVRTHGAAHVVTLINLQTPVPTPASVPAGNHLFLGMNDIAEPREGFVSPSRDQVAELIAFARGWDRAAPVVVHCWAGVSRSTAAAFTIACTLRPERPADDIARDIRRLSATATPNPMIVRFADGLLERGGEMVRAAQSIGRGQMAAEGVPFRLDV